MGLPVYGREMEAVHSLGLALAYITSEDPQIEGIRRIEITAGDWVKCRRHQAWLT